MLSKMLIAFFVLAGIIITETFGANPGKYKKTYGIDKKSYSNFHQRFSNLPNENFEEEFENEINVGLQYEPIDEENVEDPCEEMFCGPGRECLIDEEGEATCECVEFCVEVDDNRRKVCSNHNDTWSSDCELYRARCLCSEGSNKCLDQKFEHLHIDYYGVCQNVQECTEVEMSDFPRRMREWLFNIMRDMVDREELSDHYKKMEEIAEENESKKWVNAAVWKWCELDGYPKDRSVSRHELFPLRAPLYSLEHCITPFLDSCDPDNDHNITIREWVKCLQLSDEEVQDMEDLCEDI